MGTYSLGPMPLGVTEGVTGGGGVPPTAVTIYPLSLAGGTAQMCDMESQSYPNFGSAIGIADPIAGAGLSGIGYNGQGFPLYSVPPGTPGLTAIFIGSLTNVPLSGRTTMEIITANYVAEWSLGYGGGGYADVITFGGYGDGGLGATSWSWTLTILGSSLSNGTIATISGTASTSQDATYAANPGLGIGEHIVLTPSRAGFVAAGDFLVLEVAVIATNGAGSTSSTYECHINFV